jgi:hypothetical protein
MSLSIRLTGRRSDTDVVLTEKIANAVSEEIY